MRKRTIAIVAVVAVALVILSIFAYTYLTYYSPPLNEEWQTQLGSPQFSLSREVYGNGSYFYLGLYGNFATQDYHYVLDSINVSSGHIIWALPINQTMNGAAYVGAPLGQALNTMGHLFFVQGELYFVAYYDTLSMASIHYDHANDSVAIVAIDPQDGSVLKAWNVNNPYSYQGIPLNFVLGGHSLYCGYQRLVGRTYETEIMAINLTSELVGWNITLGGGSANAYSPGAFEFASGGNCAIAVIDNGSFGAVNITMYSLSVADGHMIFENNLSLVYEVVGISGGSLLYASAVGNTTYLYSQSLMSGSHASTLLKVGGNSSYSPAVSLLNGHILVSGDGETSGYMLNGTLAWKTRLPYDGVNNYLSGLIPYQGDRAFYWSEVGAFTIDGNLLNNGNGINYAGTYNSFATLNTDNGHILWSRSYAPMSTVLNKQGISYQPLAISDGKVIYEWYTQSGVLHIAAGRIP